MALSTPEIRVGAIIEVTHDENGRVLKKRRRAVISRVIYNDGSDHGTEEYRGSGIKKMFIRFDEDSNDTSVPAKCCSIVKPFDHRHFNRLKQEQDILDARRIRNDAVIDTRDKDDVPIIINEAKLTGKEDQRDLEEKGLVKQTSKPKKM